MSNTMTYKGYTASMTFDADDKIIVGRVLDVDDIISFHGESVVEFEVAFHAGMDGWVAAHDLPLPGILQQHGTGAHDRVPSHLDEVAQGTVDAEEAALPDLAVSGDDD